jgi:hypothetical protein
LVQTTSFFLDDATHACYDLRVRGGDGNGGCGGESPDHSLIRRLFLRCVHRRRRSLARRLVVPPPVPLTRGVAEVRYDTSAARPILGAALAAVSATRLLRLHSLHRTRNPHHPLLHPPHPPLTIRALHAQMPDGPIFTGVGRAAARVHTTNNDTDWTKTKRSHASLAHDAGLANGRHAKRHATRYYLLSCRTSLCGEAGAAARIES